MKSIQVTRARLHNLKSISVEIPRGKMVAITGVSGSGKTTLAFDLLYEEGRRRYLRSIGMLADLAEEIGCERITGLGPTVAVKQGIIRQSNPRSSVGTKSGIHALLSMLFVYEGRRPCPRCSVVRRANETCPACGAAGEGLRSGYFSYNSPLGMCLKCQGLGYLFELNMERLVPTPQTTMRELLERACSQTTFGYLLRGMFKDFADIPFQDVPEAARRHLLFGLQLGDGRLSHNLYDHLRWKLLKGREVNGCMEHRVCPACEGQRIGQDAREVTLLGRHIGQLSQITLAQLGPFLRALAGEPSLAPLGINLVNDILRLVEVLCKNGLGHLTLYREVPSLSGGELQRLFLSSHIDNQLDSLIYILDEPTVGLHEVEKKHLLEQLIELKAQDNTVLLVEHDPGLIRAADYVIDIGPLAGSAGGEITYEGSVAGLLDAPNSITGRYLSGRAALPRRMKIPGPPLAYLCLRQVQTNNLKNVSVDLPLGRLVGVAGVSGSGKSSLIMKTLAPLLERHFDARDNPQVDDEQAEIEEGQTVFISGRLEGTEGLDGFYTVSQQPIGRHENSNPATYLKLWDSIRKLFAAAPEAAALGLTAAHFSFNARGACPTCAGAGKQRTWLTGALFATRVCPACQGRRFTDEVLQAHYKGKTILDVLNMPVAEACSFFAGESRIVRVLDVLARSGMGYLPLGQPAPTLSGGEAQRVKLAYEISRAAKNRVLYILDEPTIGLSVYDTAFLMQLVDELVAKGNTVVVIEHDPLVLSNCDWLIELGPGGGHEGGQVIATGSPAELRQNPASIIGKYLHD